MIDKLLTNQQFLTHRRLLGTRLYLHIFVRLLVSLVIIIGAQLAVKYIGIHSLNIEALIYIALVIAVYNVLAYIIVRIHYQPEESEADYIVLKKVMYCSIVLDFIALTFVVWYAGGARSPLLSFYLLHVIISTILLSKRGAIALTILAYLLLTSLVLAEWFKIIPVQLPSGMVSGEGGIDGRYVTTLLVMYGILFGLTAFLMIGLSGALRRGEQQLHTANIELDNLSRMRRDFLHIALHNLHSPIGATTMLLNNIRAGLGGPMTEQQDQWLNRCLARLDGLSGFMRDLQTLATLENVEIDARTENVNLLKCLKEMVEENQDVAKAHEHLLILDLPQSLPTVRGIEILLREAIVNYITNAIKFTPKGGEITVRARYLPPNIRIEVIDNGIGISQADQELLFNEFVRLDKRDSTLPNKIEGSGLGLSIVKRVVEAHGGRAGVESEIHKGSTFYVELPAVT